MSRAGRITRRGFLVASAAIAGGVAFGAYVVRRPHDNPLADGLAEGAASFNPWVVIDATGITLITPHADIGQGATSVQAALIAEEMDLDWGQFRTSFGTPSPAYWNRAAAGDAVPFMASDDSRSAEGTRAVVTAMLKVIGMQATGGSTMVPDSYDKLRRAGAVARETLKLAAARRRGLDAGDLTTASGRVILPDGSAIAYTELAAEAATLDPVQDVALRAPQDWRLLGKGMPRLDMVAKSTGTQDYGIDRAVEGMVHAAVRANPRRGGGLEDFDATEALAMPGVRDVFAIEGGIAVLAEDSWSAMQAAGAVDCTWGPAPYPPEQDGHWQLLEQSFIPERLDRTWRDEGDVEAALGAGGGDGQIAAAYRAPYLAHAPLEPLSAILRVDAEGVEVWSGHQLPRLVQRHVGEVTGHDPDQVVFHNEMTGGSFGHRLEFQYLRQGAEIAARVPGTPVKLTYSREEDFAQDFPRHIAAARGRGRVAEGRVLAMDLEIAAPSVTASQSARAGIPVPGPDGQIAAGAWNNPYQFDNLRLRAYRAEGLAPVSSWRSVGASAAGFFFDSFLDELIHAAGADPLDERLRLMEDPRGRAVLEAVGEMCSWGADPGPGRGRGVAFVESFGVPVAEVVEVAIGAAGAVGIEKVWVACEVGRVIDPQNFENQVQGGVVFGLGHAMNSAITYADGMVEQENYWDHAGMRLDQCPEIAVRGLGLGGPVRGIGEPPVPPAAPALANAIFAATGKRLREMPFNREVDFL